MNDNQLTQEVVLEQFNKIPHELQEFIKNVNIREEIGKFTSIRQLSSEITQQIENEVMLILLGLESNKDLFKNIKDNVDIKEDDAQSITTKIRQVLFSSLEEAFDQMESRQEAEENLMETRERETLKPQVAEIADEEVNLDRKDILTEIENPQPGIARFEKMGPSDSRPAKETVQEYSEEKDPYRETI